MLKGSKQCVACKRFTVEYKELFGHNCNFQLCHTCFFKSVARDNKMVKEQVKKKLEDTFFEGWEDLYGVMFSKRYVIDKEEWEAWWKILK